MIENLVLPEYWFPADSFFYGDELQSAGELVAIMHLRLYSN